MKSDDKSQHPSEQLAARIADDEPIDWQAYAANTSDVTLSGLREMQQLVQGYRHLQVGLGRDTPRSCRFRFGALNVIEPLGSGSQGDVWRAYDPMLDLQVALKLRKVESATLSHRFLDEAKCLARVRQANIVSVYGAAIHDGRAGLWTELIRGDSLAELLARHGPFPFDEVRGIGIDLCHALAAVHRHGLLHGDIKTENVMREVSGRIVLMDFGAAADLGGKQAAVITGSVNYLAPEVLRGAAPSVASDIYALGVLLFRLLSGAYPYDAADVPALLLAQDRAARVRLDRLRPDIPRSLLAAIESALQCDPQRRPATALAFAAALAAPAGRLISRSGKVGAIAALAALVLLGIGVALHWGLPAAAAPWQTEMAFRRMDAQGSSALADGAQIALGDRLALQFQSDRPAFVYIFDDDGSPQTAVLFPLDGVEPHNPLAADVAYRLPGKSGSTSLTWQVSSTAAREAFIVIAADTPQDKLEQIIAGLRHAAAAGTSSTRGALNLVPAPAEPAIENAALSAILAELDHSPANAHVRTWRFTFPHKNT